MSCRYLLQSGPSGDGREMASTLCRYVLRMGDLFVLNWARVRRGGCDGCYMESFVRLY